MTAKQIIYNNNTDYDLDGDVVNYEEVYDINRGQPLLSNSLAKSKIHSQRE